MSVTIQELLTLPSLKKAKVIAGIKGITKIVSSISVLEYAESSILQSKDFNSSEFYGSELVITGFFNVKDDVDKQLLALRWLHDVGEVGLVIYYVGIIVEQIDPRVIELANALDFPLICMPPNTPGLRYSEVIYEVMEAIIKDRDKQNYIVSEILERISNLPDHQRSMDTLLRILRDTMTSSLYILDANLSIINQACWAGGDSARIQEILEYYDNHIERFPKVPTTITINSTYSIALQPIQSDMISSMYLLVVKENGEVLEALWKQAIEVVHLFITIWSKKHGEVGMQELIQSILQDEPIKMRRFAQIMQIDIQSIHTMFLLLPSVPMEDKAQLDIFHQTLEKKVKEDFCYHYKTSLIGQYDNDFVIFTGDVKQLGNYEEHLQTMVSCQELSQYGVVIISSPGMQNTRDVRNSYITCNKYMEYVKTVFPTKRMITIHDVEFVQECKSHIDLGEHEVEKYSKQLEPLQQVEEKLRHELLTTLEVFLLDANMSVTKTSELLYVHKNTIKYRLGKLKEMFYFKIGQMPDTLSLYKAVAIYRLLQNQK